MTAAMPVHRKGAMMRKSRIWAVVCSLVFVVNCSACKGTEQEVLLIGQQGAGQTSVLDGQQAAGQAPLPDGQQGTGQVTLPDGQQAGTQGNTPAGGQGTGQPGSGQWTGQGISQGETAGEICVYVCGAVEKPGVVFLPDGSRAADALEAAGGFAPGAAEEAVNLAARVSDGEKLFFPDREEYEAQAEAEVAAASGLVNINTADTAQLCTLPGIGESRAADIIAYREAHGDFAACEDIMQVPGIKESVYNKINGRIAVK